MKILLVTSSVRVLANDSRYDDSSARELQTYTAINKLIAYFDIVYLVDGSNYGFDLIESHISADNLAKIRVHSFQQDVTHLGKYGKALGELLIYQEFLRISKDDGLINFSIVKISGRWFINNFSNIERRLSENDNLFVQYYPKVLEYRKYVQTCFYKIEYARMGRLVRFGLDYYLVRQNTTFMERMMYEFLTQGNRTFINMEYPDYSGVVSGSTGEKFNNGIYELTQNFFAKYFKQFCFKLS